MFDAGEKINFVVRARPMGHGPAAALVTVLCTCCHGFGTTTHTCLDSYKYMSLHVHATTMSC